MVYIKRVELRGFKTFGNETAIRLDRGLTIISGPNGSGKSNILDAVRFALGELSAKEMRGETLADLVHKGVSSSSNSAYVAVEFDNSDRRIPIDSDTITISREFRNDGEGTYRLNEKRVSRKQLTDLLSSADAQLVLYNFVRQNALTRFADISAEDRRETLEDIIGLGVYDDQKANAEGQLKLLTVNIQVESARIEEISQRVAGLERERNAYLKSRQVANEIHHLQLNILSNKICKANGQLTELQKKNVLRNERTEQLRLVKQKLIEEKQELEAAKQQCEDAASESGRYKLETLQNVMGEVSTAIARLHAQKNISERNLRLLEDQQNAFQRNIEDTETRIQNAENGADVLKSQLPTLLEQLERKQKELDKLSKEDSVPQPTYTETATHELESIISELKLKKEKFLVQIKLSSTRIEQLQQQLETIRSRKEENESQIETLTKRIAELETAVSEERTCIQQREHRIKHYSEIKSKLENEIEQAVKLDAHATETFTEIQAQREMAEKISSEDKALRIIHQKSKEENIVGIHGTLRTIIKANENYLPAIEAAAAGWMKALVVQDLKTAIVCTEILKKSKAGRVKIITLELLRIREPLPFPNDIPGIVGPITDGIRCEQQFKPVVDFIFGDTLLAISQKASFLASLKGFRTVALTGDLYEPAGAMETGYFRKQLDLTSLALSGQTVDQITSMLSTFQQITAKSKEELARLKQQIISLNTNQTQAEAFINQTGRATSDFQENLSRARTKHEELVGHMERLTREIGTEQTVLDTCKVESEEAQNQLTEKLQAYSTLKTSAALQTETAQSQIMYDLNQFSLTRTELENRIKSLNTMTTQLEQTRTQQTDERTRIDQQLERIRPGLTRISEELSKSNEQLKQLEEDRTRIIEEINSVSAKRSEYDDKITEINLRIGETLEQMDQVNIEATEIVTTQTTLQTQLDFHMNQLKTLGHTEPIQVPGDEEELHAAELAVSGLKRQLERIGAVNKLSVSQYEEVKDNYKQIASKIYQFEAEKMSILQTINELDKRKRDRFMEAVTRINELFSEIFTRFTGGVGRIHVEIPDNPFLGGVELRLQFRGKNEMPIGSASGGEKSVGTVCFILALQAIHPMPFYMMDEIDAHLDVMNSEKLADLLKTRSENSQFIIISLKDVTMTRGDVVHGVFQQNGVSRVITLPMHLVKRA